MFVAKTPTQSRGVQTRAKLLAAGRDAFEHDGWEGASIQGIAERAGVSVGTFYRYFDDKAELLREIAEERYASLREAMELRPDRLPGEPEPLPARTRARACLLCQRILAYHRRAPGLHGVLTQRRRHDPSLEVIAHSSDATLLAGATALLGAWGATHNPRAAALALFHAIEATVVAHVVAPVEGVDDGSLCDALADMAGALVTPRGER